MSLELGFDLAFLLGKSFFDFRRFRSNEITIIWQPHATAHNQQTSPKTFTSKKAHNCDPTINFIKKFSLTWEFRCFNIWIKCFHVWSLQKCGRVGEHERELEAILKVAPKIYIQNNHKTFVMLLYLRNKTTKHKILFRGEEVCKFIQRFVLRYQWNKARETPCIRKCSRQNSTAAPTWSPGKAEKLNNKTQLPWCIIFRARCFRW